MVQKSSINKQKLLVLAGPTGVGKTQIALELYDKLNCELISADSMQVYKGCNVGTAKLSKELLEKFPHHNIDIIDIDEEYNTAIFKENTTKLIDEITAKNKLPIVVGGTGLYIESLLFPYDFAKSNRDENYRKELQQILDEKGKEGLYAILQEKDPKIAEKVDKNNSIRIIRALEIIKNNDAKLSDMRRLSQFEEESPYDYFIVFVTRHRESLYSAINTRVDDMLNNGLIEEARYIYEKQKENDDYLQVASAIGYKEFFDYFEGKSSLLDCISKVKQHTRNYAKRQITWYNRYSKNIVRLSNECEDDHSEIVETILSKYEDYSK